MAGQPSTEFLALQRAVAGRYSLDRELGRGGMGIVFLARDVALDRPVAMKLLPPTLAISPDLRERFLREARTAAQLSHPHIVPIHAVEEHGDLVFFVMGYVDGESLGQRVRRAGPLMPSAVIRLVQEVAWALAYAHGRGVIHRDVKPDNILLEKGSGRALVTDFGIARVTDQTGVTARGEILGTAHYMSPEQASGEATDGRSDLYSLGVTAYFALTGNLPFDGPSLPAILARVMTEPAPKVAAARRDAPPRLAEAVDRCLAKQPGARFATGEALADAVGAAQTVTRGVPPEVRYLFRTAREMDVWAGFALLLIYVGPPVVKVLWPTDRGALLWLGFVLGAQLVTIPVMLVRATRRALKAGLGHEDVHVALEHEVRSRVEEDRAILGPHGLAPPPERRRLWTRLGLSLTLGGAGVTAAGAALGLGREAGLMLPATAAIVIGVVILGGTVMMRVVARVTSDPPRIDGLPRRRALGLGLRLLDGRLGRWLFRLAGLGLEAGRQNRPPATERTELVLGGAADALFQALPADARRRFADVPGAIDRLERDAGRLREREQALSAALALAVPERAPQAEPTRRETAMAELASARDVARDRLATAVAALENIRLDLLRLQAGLGSPDDLTADLEKAREINAAVSAELEGRREVERVVMGTAR